MTEQLKFSIIIEAIKNTHSFEMLVVGEEQAEKHRNNFTKIRLQLKTVAGKAHF